MNILVIGNGFDLAHNLPTSYNNFIDVIRYIQGINNDSNIDMIIKDKIRDYKESQNIYYNELEMCVKENGWIEYFKQNLDLNKNWVDFEEEISWIIKLIDVCKNENDDDIELIEKQKITIEDNLKFKVFKFIKIFNSKDETIKRWTNYTISNIRLHLNKELFMKMENDLKRLIRALEIYLSLFVESIYNGCVGKIENINKVISFNYTNTYQRLYDKSGNIEYDYIHGKVNIEGSIEKNNMVLGIDEYLDDERKDKDLEFIFFKKYFQRIYKRTGCNYKKWLEEIDEYNEESNIYFYGHSLSRADKDILKELILCDNMKVTIFYHNDEAYRSQITNLVDVIGQDKLIEKVYGGNPTIVFISTEHKEKLEIIGEEAEKYDSLILGF